MGFRILSSSEIRKNFINFFKLSHQHSFIPSSPLKLKNDPSLLFVNAGMNQFKHIFLNNMANDYPYKDVKRAVNSQKCIRTGGKHNDLDKVGTNFRHHTFFEMLGNWSFGDYFKREACSMAWDLLINVFALPKEQIFVTYFGGDKNLGLPPDNETHDIWLSLGLPKEKVIPLDAKENFWEMGETGPCGSCTEIHYVLNPKAKPLSNSSLEIWNLVFIEYNKNKNGKLSRLPSSHVDTGMGLERIASIMASVNSNYDTDLFQPLIRIIHEETKSTPYQGTIERSLDIAYRIISDHSRMLTVALSDGIVPSGRDQGRHLRKVLRRAHWHLLNDFQHKDPAHVLVRLSLAVCETLGDFYPEIASNIQSVGETLRIECNNFEMIINKSKILFENLIQKLNEKQSKTLSGEDVFDLFLSHGTPTTLIELLANKYKVNVDWNKFSECFAEHKKKSALGLAEK